MGIQIDYSVPIHIGTIKRSGLLIQKPLMSRQIDPMNSHPKTLIFIYIGIRVIEPVRIRRAKSQFPILHQLTKIRRLFIQYSGYGNDLITICNGQIIITLNGVPETLAITPDEYMVVPAEYIDNACSRSPILAPSRTYLPDIWHNSLCG